MCGSTEKTIRSKTEADIQKKYDAFKRINDEKRIMFIVSSSIWLELSLIQWNSTASQFDCLISTKLSHLHAYLQEKANAHNDKLCSEIVGTLEAEILTQINDLNSDFSEINLNSALDILRQNAVNEVCHLYSLFIIILSMLDCLSLFLNFEKKNPIIVHSVLL